MSKWRVNKHTFLRRLTNVNIGHVLNTSHGTSDTVTYPG